MKDENSMNGLRRMAIRIYYIMWLITDVFSPSLDQDIAFASPAIFDTEIHYVENLFIKCIKHY